MSASRGRVVVVVWVVRGGLLGETDEGAEPLTWNL